MAYLKNSAEGKRLIRENYVISLILLKEIHNDKQLLIYSHMQKLILARTRNDLKPPETT